MVVRASVIDRAQPGYPYFDRRCTHAIRSSDECCDLHGGSAGTCERWYALVAELVLMVRPGRAG
ncbi:MAG: hypothetical protein DYH15_06860 [Nitrosomonas sp. PRO4]|nr:hypothetical protein [Nitrosomonas sp. PRO4]